MRVCREIIQALVLIIERVTKREGKMRGICSLQYALPFSLFVVVPSRRM